MFCFETIDLFGRKGRLRRRFDTNAAVGDRKSSVGGVDLDILANDKEECDKKRERKVSTCKYCIMCKGQRTDYTYEKD